jgi:hypothetical protein
MGPTVLSMVQPGGTGTSTPKEPYVDLLIGDVYCLQPLLKPPCQRGKKKICDLIILQDNRIEYYAATGAD